MCKESKAFQYGTDSSKCVNIRIGSLDDFSKEIPSSIVSFKFFRMSASLDKGPVLQLLQGMTIFIIALGDRKTIPSDLFKNSDGTCVPVYIADKDCDGLRNRLKELGVEGIDVRSVYDQFYELYKSELPAKQDQSADRIYKDISEIFSKQYSKLIEEFPNAPNVSDICDVSWDTICKDAPVYCYHCLAIRDIKVQYENHQQKACKKKESPHVSQGKKPTHVSPDKKPITVELTESPDNKERAKKDGKKGNHSPGGKKHSSMPLPASVKLGSDEEARKFAKTFNWEKCMVIEKDSNLDLAELHLMCTNNGSYLSYVSDRYIFYGFPGTQEVSIDIYRRSMPDTNIFLV